MTYRIARIPKGRGAFREICVPTPEFKMRLRKHLPILENILANHDKSGANYAFERGKNCALNALQHVGYQHTLSFDLQDFFGSVCAEHVAHAIPEWVIEECFVEGAPKQGLPTSPLIATIAFLRCDALILEYLRKLKIDAVYTRYADDLVFSFDNVKQAGKISTVVRQVVEQAGFKLNEKKTKLQIASNGRIVVTGIAIDAKGLHPTRRTQKKIRAARHQANGESTSGLEEWAKCKLPSP